MWRQLFHSGVVLLGLTSCQSKPPKAAAGVDPSTCPFCKDAVIARQQVMETEYWRVLLDHKPLAKGHLLVVPKQHKKTRHELTYEETDELFGINQRIRAASIQIFGSDSEDIQYEKNGLLAGQSVNHLHIHVIPITKANASKAARTMIFVRMLGNRRVALTEEQVVTQVRQWRTLLNSGESETEAA